MARQEPPASAGGMGTTHTTPGRSARTDLCWPAAVRVHASHQIIVRLSSTQVGGGKASASLSGRLFPCSGRFSGLDAAMHPTITVCLRSACLCVSLMPDGCMLPFPHAHRSCVVISRQMVSKLWCEPFV